MTLLEKIDGERRWDNLNRRWWKQEDPSEALWQTVKRIKDSTTWRAQSDELSMKLYSDCKIVGFRGSTTSWDVDDVLEARMGDNQLRAIVRTLHSKTIRHRPKPVVLTQGGSWKLKQKAKNLDTWINGKIAQLKCDNDIFPQAALHALVFGTGIVRSYGDPEEGACLEVIPPYEVFVDDSEARYGSPRSIYIVRVVDRSVLLAKYPEAEEVIMKAGNKTNMNEWSDFLSRWDSDLDADLLVTIEGIHCRSSKNSDDGVISLAVDSGLIFKEEWKRDHLPIAVIRGERRPLGFWGIGVGEDLAGSQLEINRTILARQQMIRLLSVPFWLVERGSKVVKSHISNMIGRVVEYSGTPPQLVTPAAVPTELWQHTDNLKKSMFESRGVSQLTAQAIKPAGLNSGKALRTYTDLESELLVDLIRSYENLVIDCANLLIEEQEELGKEYAKQAVTRVGRGKIETITWKEAQLSEDQYRIQVQPASSLSSSVSGRIEDIYDLRDLGAITDPEEIRELLDLPDLKSHGDRSMSHRYLLEMVIEQKILTEGQDITPEPFWDLALAVKLGLQYLTQAQFFDDIEQGNIEKLRVFIKICTKMLAPPTPEEPVTEAPQADPMMDPTAVEGMPMDLSAPPGPAAPVPGELPPGPEMAPPAV